MPATVLSNNPFNSIMNLRYKQKMGEPPIFCFFPESAGQSVTKITLESNSLGTPTAAGNRPKAVSIHRVRQRTQPPPRAGWRPMTGPAAMGLPDAGYCI
ncbi:MAG: hypothetical protein HYU76_04205 [Betaproteobacteria bacterium]|nr:hypothetical protein [Betaproteobacteria bacterium]